MINPFRKTKLSTFCTFPARQMYCVCLNTSINQLRLTLSTLHAEMCCCKHTISTVWATHVESRNHEELRHVGLAPIALCELMSREKVSQNDFAVSKKDFAVSENDFAVAKLILPWVKRFCREWKWFCRGEIDFAVSKKILPWQLWATAITSITYSRTFTD